MKRGLWVLGALLLLHALTVLPYPYEGLGARAWLAPNADLAVILALLAVAALAGGGRVVVHVAAFITLFVPLYRFGATLMPAVHGKPFEPWTDLYELPGLLHLITHDRPLAWQIAIVGGALGGLLLIYWLTLRACRIVLETCRVRAVAVFVLVALQVMVALPFLRDTRLKAPESPWRASMLASSVGAAITFVQNGEWLYRDRFEQAARETGKRLDAIPATCEGLGGADVYVIFLESYGRAALQGAVFDRYAGWLSELEASLAGSGYAARAAWIAPSVSGGLSVPAHLEFLSGIEVPDRRVMNLLLASGVRVLPELLRRQGYHTVNVQPAMPRAWPEAKGLGYEVDLFQTELNYDGHAYHWGLMPDQFALQRALATIVRPAQRPLFLEFVSVTSHCPFRDVPPYFTDWAQAGVPGAFARPPAKTFPLDVANFTTHEDVLEAYLAVTEYGLRCAIDFLRQTGRPTLAFVLGDHQPPLPERVAPDRSFDVPIHAISNRPELLLPLADIGFTPGLTPPRDGKSFSSARFLPAFLRAYAPPHGAPRDGK